MTALGASGTATEGNGSGWYAALPLVRRLPVEWQPNPRVFLTMLPVLVFYGLTKVAPPEIAIGGGFAAVTVVFFLTRETPVLRLIAIYGYVITAGSALAGILLTSEKAYLAAGPVGDALILPLYAWTLWRGWPLIGAIGREISPRMVGTLPVNAPIFVKRHARLGRLRGNQGAGSDLDAAQPLYWGVPGLRPRVRLAHDGRAGLHLRHRSCCARRAGTALRPHGLPTTPRDRAAPQRRSS